MASLTDWQITPNRQPKASDYAFDLAHALAPVVGIRSIVPDDAFTAETLGTERAGSGVFIREGVVLTIGYLITEAQEIWITLGDDRVIPGHALGSDSETGFGLVQALAHVDLPVLPLGDSDALSPGTNVIVAGAGGQRRSVAGVVVGRQEFAGYWEYVLEKAIFTAPAHPFWGGTAVIGPAGDLVGIGSLQLEQATSSGESGNLNMVVPIDLLKPILGDLLTTGRTARPVRPWLGLFATEIEGKVYIAGTASEGPADKAGLQQADRVLAVAGTPVADLAGLFRQVWAQGTAGVEVPLTIMRDGEASHVLVSSADRNAFLKAPKLHS